LGGRGGRGGRRGRRRRGPVAVVSLTRAAGAGGFAHEGVVGRRRLQHRALDVVAARGRGGGAHAQRGRAARGPAGRGTGGRRAWVACSERLARRLRRRPSGSGPGAAGCGRRRHLARGAPARAAPPRAAPRPRWRRGPPPAPIGAPDGRRQGQPAEAGSTGGRAAGAGGGQHRGGTRGRSAGWGGRVGRAFGDAGTTACVCGPGGRGRLEWARRRADATPPVAPSAAPPHAAAAGPRGPLPTRLSGRWVHFRGLNPGSPPQDIVPQALKPSRTRQPPSPGGACPRWNDRASSEVLGGSARQPGTAGHNCRSRQAASRGTRARRLPSARVARPRPRLAAAAAQLPTLRAPRAPPPAAAPPPPRPPTPALLLLQLRRRLAERLCHEAQRGARRGGAGRVVCAHAAAGQPRRRGEALQRRSHCWVGIGPGAVVGAVVRAAWRRGRRGRPRRALATSGGRGRRAERARGRRERGGGERVGRRQRRARVHLCICAARAGRRADARGAACARRQQLGGRRVKQPPRGGGAARERVGRRAGGVLEPASPKAWR
jgi:hypothetical protein